jgi:hypothetical protein
MENIFNNNKTYNEYKNEKLNILNKNNNTNTLKNILNIDDNKYIINKKDNINSQYKNLLVLEDNNQNYKYRITRINIDSKNRNIIPKNIPSNNNILLNNPFSVTQNSNNIIVTINNHNLKLNDKIIITNVKGLNYYLNKLEIVNGSPYIKIYHNNHGMIPFTYSQTNYIPYKILISDLTNNNLSHISNIPLNIINNFHIVYFNIDNSNNYDINSYYININIVSNESLVLNNIYYNVSYCHLYGIPLYDLNANYPINNERNKGYHIITTIYNNNTFGFTTNYIANNTIANCGGNDIVIDKIVNYIEGYPDNNYYKISLNKIFYNVTKILLISTEIPNTQKIIRNYPRNKQNNLLYWQIADNSNNTYSISITAGNYDVKNLINELVIQIQNTNINIINNNLNILETTYFYSPTFYTNISIDINTSIFNITFYGQITIQNPFKITQDILNKDIFYIDVYHPAHMLQVNTEIIILNSNDIGFVPSTAINGVQTIYSIIDINRYIIKITKFNIIESSTNLNNLGGGLAVNIRYPFVSRLLFNFPGTIGNILGFRNVGQHDSITKWNTIISNNDLYYNDLPILVNTIGQQINQTSINNYINLNGDNYILLANPLFKNTIDTGNINGVFAKLLLSGSPGYILFNQFIQLGEELIDGITSLSELEFYFYSPDNTLYSFNGIDHSFTLEIYEKVYNNINLHKYY